MAPNSARIRAGAVEVGDRISHLEQDFVVTKIKLDGGFLVLHGGDRPISVAAGERVTQLESDSAEDA